MARPQGNAPEALDLHDWYVARINEALSEGNDAAAAALAADYAEQLGLTRA